MSNKLEPSDLAFPVSDTDGNVYSGMTIREHFASIAMQGITSKEDAWGEDHAAKTAVKYADALISELNKGVS